MLPKGIYIKLVPNAAKSEVVGWEGDRLKVKVKAVPEKGRANEELIEVLSKHLNIPKSKLKIVKGMKSRLKKVEIIT